MTDEKALIRKILDGDQEAFAILVTAYEKQVYNLCLRMCGNQEDARDLAQEAFLKAWRRLQFYQSEASFSTWLYRLTTNVCIDFLRQKKRRPTVSLTVDGDSEEGQELDLPDGAPSPEDRLLHQETSRAVQKAMEQLDEEFRLVLTLRVVEDLSYEEIARVLDLNTGTVKSRLARARIKLRKILLQSGNKLESNSSNQPKEGRRTRHEL